MQGIETLAFQHGIVVYGKVISNYEHFFDIIHNTGRCKDNPKKFKNIRTTIATDMPKYVIVNKNEQ